MSRIRLAFACIALMVPALARASPLYLQDFDQGPAGWTSAIPDTLDLADDPTAPSPPFVQRITKATDVEAFSSPLVAVPAGSTLCISVWLDWHSGGWPMVGMHRYDGTFADAGSQLLLGYAGTDNGQGGVVQPVPEVDGWHRYLVDVQLPLASSGSS
jgi:hypothetical protein